MSRAVFKDSKTNSPSGSNKALHHRGVVENYKRRLSLAVPERPRFQRGRSPSDVTNLRGANLESFMDGNALLPEPILKSSSPSKSPDKHHIENETHYKKQDDEKKKGLQKSYSEGETARKRPFLAKTKHIFTSISEEEHEAECEDEEGETEVKTCDRLIPDQGHTESDPDLSKMSKESGGRPSSLRKASYNKAVSDPTSETVELKSYKKKEQ